MTFRKIIPTDVLLYTGPIEPVFSTLHRGESTNSAIDCRGNETSLASCPILTIVESTCQYLLIDCQETNSEEYDNETIPVIIANDNTTGGGIDNETTSAGNDTNVTVGDVSEESGTGEGNNNTTTTDGSGAEGSETNDDSGNDGGDVSASGSGSDPTVETTHEPTALSPEVAPTIKSRSKLVPVEVLSAVTAAAITLVILTLMAALLLVWVRRKRKRTPTVQVEDYEDIGPTSRGNTEKGGEKHLNNPTYNGCSESPDCPQAVDITEHHVVNPLYELNPEGTTDAELYAVLECPNYAVPGEVCLPLTPTDCEAPHNYDYADIPDSKTDAA